jgi:hypothetical protein
VDGALPAKRKRQASKKKVLADDSDFSVSEGGEAANEEGVDDSSEQDDFVERTQNAKKSLKRKKKQPVSNKYKGIEFKALSKELFKVACVIHCKQKVKIGETARLQKIESAATAPIKPAPQGLISSFCTKDKKSTTEATPVLSCGIDF